MNDPNQAPARPSEGLPYIERCQWCQKATERGVEMTAVVSWVECYACGANGPIAATSALAIAAWNRRAADPRAAAVDARGVGEAPDEMFDEAERVLKPYIELIPPQCDSHGRVDVIPTTDGDEVCEICHGDGFSGELGHVHADTVAIEVVAALWKMVQANYGVLKQDAEHNAARAERAEAEAKAEREQRESEGVAYRKEIGELRGRCVRAEERAGGLQRFKDYVHQRLDAMSVPAVIDDAHLANGCRIGGRLDYVEQLIGRLFAQVAWAEAKEPAAQPAPRGEACPYCNPERLDPECSYCAGSGRVR